MIHLAPRGIEETPST
uniref:Uncharacterized protein n=1 Tax=Arundo donax TaxID=35708 RepID=A0A0A9EZ12_ARUDO